MTNLETIDANCTANDEILMTYLGVSMQPEVKPSSNVPTCSIDICSSVLLPVSLSNGS